MTRLGASVIALALGAVACDALFGDTIQCTNDADCVQLRGVCGAGGTCTASHPTDPAPAAATIASSAADAGGAPSLGSLPEADAGVVGSTTSRYRAAVLADVPLLYLRLAETGGTVAKDETGKSDGSYSAIGLSYGAPGALAGDSDTAMRFDGTGRISMPAGADFGALRSFTVELWFRADAKNTMIGYLLDHETFGPRVGWNLRVGDAANFERWGSDTAASAVGTSPPAAGVWHHLVGVFDSGTQYLYVDGALAAHDGSGLALPERQTVFTIGHQNCDCGDGTAFVGDLDEIAVYDKALSAQSVAVHYAAAK